MAGSCETNTVASTQIFHLIISPLKDLGDPQTEAGRQWSQLLDILETTPGYQRLYWGRRLEEPQNVQLHVVRDTLQNNHDFLASSTYLSKVYPILESLTISPTSSSSSQSSTFTPDAHAPPSTSLKKWPPPPPPIYTRHVPLRNFAPNLGPSPGGLLKKPIGTAIYVNTTDAWNEGAWPLWSHVVRHVDGCRSIAGGLVEEDIVGAPGDPGTGFLVYVGWESVKHHDAYHHTKHFRNRYIILNMGNEGYVEYGHIIFEEARQRGLRKGQGAKL